MRRSSTYITINKGCFREQIGPFSAPQPLPQRTNTGATTMSPRTDTLAARATTATKRPRRQTQSMKAKGSGSRSVSKKAVSKSKKNPKKQPPKKARGRKAITALKDPTEDELQKAVDQFTKKVHGNQEPDTNEFYKAAFQHAPVRTMGRVWWHHENPVATKDHEESKGARHKQVLCHVCAHLHTSVPQLMGTRPKDATQGCKLCRRGFHTDCWTIFHRPQLFIEADPPVRKDLITFLYHHLWSKDPFPSEDHSGSYSLGYVQNILMKHEEAAIVAKVYPKKKKKTKKKKSSGKKK